MDEVILDKILYLHPEDSKTNVCIPFSLEKRCLSLEFFCSYEPKKCDDRERAKQQILAALESYVPAEYRDRNNWPESCPPMESFLPSVVSLITLSVDAPAGKLQEYLGCAHRHANEQRLVISAGFSSPGFFRRSPEAGDWRAVINVHAVVSREVKYRLVIIAHNGDS